MDVVWHVSRIVLIHFGRSSPFYVFVFQPTPKTVTDTVKVISLSLLYIIDKWTPRRLTGIFMNFNLRLMNKFSFFMIGADG